MRAVILGYRLIIDRGLADIVRLRLKRLAQYVIAFVDFSLFVPIRLRVLTHHLFLSVYQLLKLDTFTEKTCNDFFCEL